MQRRRSDARAAVVMRMAMPQRPGEGRNSSHVMREQYHHTGASARLFTRGRRFERE